jgi:hypothetical protein
MESLTNCQVDLDRLIVRCEAHLDRASTKTGKIKLENAVRKMEELLVLVEKTAPAEQVSKQQRSVERFRALLNSSSSHVAVPAAIRLAVAGGELSSEQKTAHVGASARAMALHREHARDELLETRPEKIAWEKFSSSAARPSTVASTSTTEDLINYHKEEQERLSEDLLAGATFLNSAATAIEMTLKTDAARLKELGELSGENSAILSKEGNRIKKQTGRTCSFTLITIGVCCVVLVVFLWMVMLIRMTSKSK